MRSVITVFLPVSACLAKAQVTVNFGGGVNNRGYLVSNIEVGYEFRKINLGAGYLIGLTDCVNAPDLVFLKAAGKIKLGKKSTLDLGSGLAFHSYKVEQISKVDGRYSSFKTIHVGKPLFIASYQKRVRSDGAFYTQVIYSGNIFYAGVGLKYFFKQKGKNGKEKQYNSYSAK